MSYFGTSGHTDADGRGAVEETYSHIIEHAKSHARRYAALETRDGRAAAAAVLRFARSLRAEKQRLSS